MNNVLSYEYLQFMFKEKIFIDVLELNENGATAVKNVSTVEGFFEGHFPQNPIMPGVLQIQALFQSACVFIDKKHSTRNLFITEIDKVRFKNPVQPGNQLIITITVTKNENSYHVKGTGKVNNKVCCQASFSLAKMNESLFKQQPSLISQLHEDLHNVEGQEVYNAQQIKSIIPHRYPFNFLDKINVLKKEEMVIIGEKLVTYNDPLITNTKTHSYLDSAIITETAAQLGCVFMLGQEENKNKIGVFLAIENAKFYALAQAGNRIILKLTMLFSKGNLGKCKGLIYTNKHLIAEIELAFAIIDGDKI